MSLNNLEIITLNEPGVTDFAFARNLLLQKSKAEWVFFVDSDEVVPKELTEEVNNVIKDSKYDGYYIKRKIYFLGKFTGEDKVLRLGKKNSEKWTRAVHEVWNIKHSKVGELQGFIIHNTAKNLHEYIDKMNKYSSLHAKENLNEGKRSNLFKIIFYPSLKFLQNILMGRGFVFSLLQSFHSFLAWSKEWKLQNA